jgi:hypothetical protein
MDLNYLLHRQQVERSRAETASTEAARKAHEELARQYEGQIEALTGSALSFPVQAPVGTDEGSRG